MILNGLKKKTLSQQNHYIPIFQVQISQASLSKLYLNLSKQ
jgi:hypothetical protein